MWRRIALRDEGAFLFARLSFLRGAAMLFDARGSLSTYNESPTPADADRRATRADWAAVAADLRSAFDLFHAQEEPAAREAA